MKKRKWPTRLSFVYKCHSQRKSTKLNKEQTWFDKNSKKAYTLYIGTSTFEFSLDRSYFLGSCSLEMILMTFSNFNNGNLITFKLHNRQDKIMVTVFT